MTVLEGSCRLCCASQGGVLQTNFRVPGPKYDLIEIIKHKCGFFHLCSRTAVICFLSSGITQRTGGQQRLESHRSRAPGWASRESRARSPAAGRPKPQRARSIKNRCRSDSETYPGSATGRGWQDLTVPGMARVGRDWAKWLVSLTILEADDLGKS
jgi:hypothetical protein